VAKEDQISSDGVIEEVLPNAMFRVKLAQGPIILGHISGRMRQNKIQILTGDRVRIEMSPYDLMPKHSGPTPHDSPTGTNPYAAPNKSNMHYRANESTGALGAYNNYNASYDTNNISYKPYYAKMGGNANVPLDNRLLEKINYMIHLLEEQQVEKSSNITEEFILYTFLGIFVIFVVDSFSRSGKYIR
jgi:translation initiation factor IF-1